MLRFIILFSLISSGVISQESQYYFTNNGDVSFRSEAQQELIKARSSDMRGVIDPSKRTFVFKVIIRTFRGFNSSLQQEHFNEKYLESEIYPEAIFNGKIIEDLDFSIEGNYEIRAKGKLNIHGVEMERIIRCKVTTKKNIINIESLFSINLYDHNIKVPKVVHEKIAKEVLVEIKAELIQKK